MGESRIGRRRRTDRRRDGPKDDGGRAASAVGALLTSATTSLVVVVAVAFSGAEFFRSGRVAFLQQFIYNLGNMIFCVTAAVDF